MKAFVIRAGDAEAFDFRFNQAPNERLFEALREAYLSSGGIARGDDLLRLFADIAPMATQGGLARRVANNELFHVQWRGAMWFPMVQMRLDDMSINAQVQQVRRLLGEHRDGWEIANWFVKDNEFLEGRRPVDLLERELPLVLQAARGEHLLPVT